MRKQWKCARFGLARTMCADITQKDIHQPRLELPAAAPGGFFDGAPQLFERHLPDVFLLGSYCLAQKRVLRAVGVKIGAQGNDHRKFSRFFLSTGDEFFYKADPFDFIVTQSENFFELIDKDQDSFSS